MGFIYKITNSENSNVYIGQTVRPIEKRFKQHLHDARKYTGSDIKLYNAINKYGEDKFKIELVEECSNEELNEREIYWIALYNSFHEGYNTTSGGHGRLQDCVKEIMSLWNKGLLIIEMHDVTGYSAERIKHALLRGGVTEAEIRKRGYASQSKKVKVPVYQYDIDGNFMAEYASIWDAEAITGINHGCIVGVLCNKHLTAGGYQWKRYRAEKIEKRKSTRPTGKIRVYQYTADGQFVAEYKSFAEAGRAVGKEETTMIRRVCKGKAMIAHGYQWRTEYFPSIPKAVITHKNQLTSIGEVKWKS